MIHKTASCIVNCSSFASCSINVHNSISTVVFLLLLQEKIGALLLSLIYRMYTFNVFICFCGQNYSHSEFILVLRHKHAHPANISECQQMLSLSQERSYFQ